jgi:hypothetical protein
MQFLFCSHIPRVEDAGGRGELIAAKTGRVLIFRGR